MNKSKIKKNQKKEQKPKDEFSGFTFAMGELDLLIEINFKDEDLLNPNSTSQNDKYLQIENMTSIKDLSFLKDKKEDFLNTIKIKPNSDFIKQIFLGNIISKKKCFIDFICYDRPKFEGDEEFFGRIFDYVTIRHKLQINKTPLKEGSRWSLIIELKHKDKIQKIICGKTQEQQKEENDKEEANKKEEEKKEKQEKEEEEKKEIEEKIKQKIQEYKDIREMEKKKKEEEKNKENDDENNEENNDMNNDNDEKNNNNEPEENKENNEEENEEEEEEENDYEENEAMKEKKIPKFKRQKSILCNLSPSCTKYNLIYLNYENIVKIPGDFKMKDLLELLTFFKKKKSIIFINFYKSEPSKEEKEKQDAQKKEEAEKEAEKKNGKAKKEEEEYKNRINTLNILYNKKSELTQKQKNIKLNKKKEIQEMNEQEKKEELDTIEQELEKIVEEEQNIRDEIRADEEVKREYKKRKDQEQEKENEKQKKKNKKEMKLLNEIFYLTNGYYFDTKQACEIFNNHYLCFTTDKIKKVINLQKVFDYFITVIARGVRDEADGNKVGLFMGNFKKYDIIYTTKKSANKQELNAQPHPKINPHNIKLIEDYKKILTKNKNEYYSIFAGLAAHEISAGNKISVDVVYPTFLTALEIIKRKLEIEKNNITLLNDEEIYKIKIDQKALQQDLERLASGNKEGGFVLDCINKSKSKIKDYVSLYDYHLSFFFSSELIRKDLKNKGFINSKGFIMYDPVYRSVMGSECQNKKKYEGNDFKTKLINRIKDLDVPARIKDKEIDTKKDVEKLNLPTDRKIPYVQRFRKKKKRKKKNSGEGSSSEGYSSSEEGKSGDSTGNSQRY